MARPTTKIGLLALASAAALLAGACAGPLERREAARRAADGPDAIDASGGSWALVMPTPGVAQMTRYADLSALPEYSRNDGRLGAEPRGPLLASAEWPEPARASLAYPRRVYLDPRPDQITFFQAGWEYRARPATSYAAPASGGPGAWGFWR